MKKASSFKQVSFSLLMLAALVFAFIPGQIAQAATAGAWSWRITGTMGAARSNHTSTLLSSSLMLVAGGYGLSGYLAGAELYNPVTESWLATGAMRSSRANHTATLLSNNKVLVAGGYNTRGYLAGAELYNPVTGRWASTGTLKNARYGHTATLLPDGKVLVAGGSGNSGALASAELYDPATGQWTVTGPLGAARSNHTATLLPDGKVLVVGGYNGVNYLATAEVYDPATGLWTATGSLTAARSTHTATLLSGGRVLVAGGDNGRNFLASAELYTPSTGLWKVTGAMKTGRALHTALLLPTGKVLVAGGRSSSYLGSAELFDPSSGTWAAIGAMKTARASHAAALLEDGNVLVTGGRGDAGLLAKAELYALEKVDQTISVTISAPTYAAFGVSFKVAATASSGLAVTYSASGSCTNVNATFTMTSGSGTCLVQYNQAGNTSYNPAPQVVQKVAARKAAITVTADAKSKIYGEPDPELTYAVTSGALAAGDDFTGHLIRVEGESVGKYAINKGTLALSDNYALTYNGADLKIEKQPITVTATAKSKVYGNADPALTYKVTDGFLVGGDMFKGYLTRAAGENVGTYAIQQGSLKINSNYTLTFVGANLTITKRPIKVKADDKSKVYGETDPELTYRITSGKLVGTDAFTGALARDAGESIGSYAIRVGTLALGSNYALSYSGAFLTILPVPPNEVTFTSSGAVDGFIVESAENSGVGGTLNATTKTFRLGDDAANRQIKTILSFDTSGLPDNAIISAVTLRIKSSGLPTGSDPFVVLGRLLVDVSNGTFGDVTLEVDDFQAAASATRVGIFIRIPVDSWYKAALRATTFGNINTTGVTQFRLYFTKDDNNNLSADFLKFSSGNSARNNRPQLIIKYTVP